MAQLRSVDRTGSAAARLAQALDVLTKRSAGDGRKHRATVAHLCRLAGVSRNSLYRYHTGTLKTLRKIQNGRSLRKDSHASRVSEPLRTENACLRAQMAKLVALVDHYYAAYRETGALLERRDRELANVRRMLNSKPAPIRR